MCGPPGAVNPSPISLCWFVPMGERQSCDGPKAALLDHGLSRQVVEVGEPLAKLDHVCGMYFFP